MPSLVPVDNFLGAFFIGVVLSSILYGVTCLQVYLYFSRHWENDRPFLKYFVAAILVLESLQMALVIHSYYIAGVTNFGDFVSDAKAPMGLILQTVIGILVECAIQHFYAWRIYKLSMGQQYIPIFIIVTSFAQLVHGIVFVVKLFRHPYYDKVADEIPLCIAILSLQVVCDLTITASMVYYLYTQRSTVKRTMSVITTLVLYSITSGALALVFAILCLIFFSRFPSTLIYFPFFAALVRVYVCAFLTILNSRDGLRTKLSTDAQSRIMITMPALRFTPDSKPGGNTSGTSADAVTDTMDLRSTDLTSQDFAQIGGDSTLSSEVYSARRSSPTPLCRPEF